MPFTVADFHDLVRILEERPEWRRELRRLVLTDELLSLPEQVANLRAATEQRFQELTEQVAALAEAQRRFEGQMAALTAQVAALVEVVRPLPDAMADMKGRLLEIDYRTKGPAYFGRIIRRAHVLSQDELTALIEAAVDKGVLSDSQAQDIYAADVVVQGKRREDGAEVYLVVEVSWGVGPDDVARASRRAELLARTGRLTIPVVAGTRVTAEAAWLAHKSQTWQLTDGNAIPPGSLATPA